MGNKGLDFKHKEVINIVDGRRLGFVQDVNANLETGIITSIVVPGNNRLFNVFSSNDIVIPWQNIKCIGDDIILVEIKTRALALIFLIFATEVFDGFPKLDYLLALFLA